MACLISCLPGPAPVRHRVFDRPIRRSPSFYRIHREPGSAVENGRRLHLPEAWLDSAAMGQPREPAHVKLICGILSADDECMRRARRILTERFGPIETEAGPWPFDQTDYYAPEMGANLRRFFVAFTQSIAPHRLPEIKRTTNDIEATVAQRTGKHTGQRPVNLDPGYVALDKLVLATTKNLAHRIYLDRGIYAEVTLRYQKGVWRAWPWTFPDYAAETYHAFLTQVRETLRPQTNGGPAVARGS